MKILWLTNIILPKISNSIGIETVNLGGWLTGLSNGLSQKQNIELCVIFPFDKYIFGKADNISYHGFTDVEIFEDIIQKEKPDIIHIFGTEFKHTLDMIKTCEKLKLIDKVVINIQGLIFYYGKYHYLASLPNKVINSYTFRDFVKHNNIKQQKDVFLKRGEHELSAIRKVKHVVGRTDWDRACTNQINPEITYHFCNEILRDEFYKRNWHIEMCQKHSIFLSQGNYPIKGLHYMLHAMPEVLKKYPDAHIYITGDNPLMLRGKKRIKQGSYSNYIGKLIKKYRLENDISFLGNLNEEQMCDRFLKSNVFVSASTIENESNSISEAKILGVPVVASFVGGVTNRVKHKEDGFVYQHDAPYMLSYYICEIFDNDKRACELSERAKRNARIIHNKDENIKTMLEIYREINTVKD
ncbi:MAG: glycosyltransferase [Clostridia bacterium]